MIKGFRYDGIKLERTLLFDNKKYRLFNDTFINDSLYQLITYYLDENIESNYIQTPYTYTDANIQTVLRLFLF